MIAYNGPPCCTDPWCWGCKTTCWASAGNAAWTSDPRLPSGAASTEDEEDEEKERIRQDHRRECQQAFKRPPRKQGRGHPPVGKWSSKPPIRSGRKGRRR